MAMTKKERAEMDDLRRQLDEARSLLPWSADMPSTVPPPRDGRYNGWDFNAYQDCKVFEAWSECVAHGTGHPPPGPRNFSGSQNGKRLFASRLDALIALRITKTNDCAKLLAKIDAEIATEKTAVAA